MAVTVTHATAADGTFSASGQAAWDEAHSVSGLGTMAEQAANNVAITGGSIAGITDLAVADGGTGSSTAAGAATNLGLGTGDSPQFTAVNIGHATDTTLARASAGNLSVEGNLIYRAGGTDVPVADGGTGASTAATAQVNLGLGTAIKTYIRGCVVTPSSSTAISVSAGEYWDDTVGNMVSFAGGSNSPSLAASKVYSVFLANGSIEVFQEDPPSTAYAGTARKRASGNGGRFVGWFLTNSSSQIISFRALEMAPGEIQHLWKATTSTSPFRMLALASSPTSYGAITSLITCVPRYVVTDCLMLIMVSISAGTDSIGYLQLSVDGVNDNSGGFGALLATTGQYPYNILWAPVEQSTPGIYYRVDGPNPEQFLDVMGFKYLR